MNKQRSKHRTKLSVSVLKCVLSLMYMWDNEELERGYKQHEPESVYSLVQRKLRQDFNSRKRAEKEGDLIMSMIQEAQKAGAGAPLKCDVRPEHLHSVLIAKKADPVFTQYALSAYDVDGEYYCKIYGQQASYSDEETDNDE